MKNYFLAFLFFIATALSPETAFASCMARQSIEKEAGSASLIFIGTATKITPARIAGSAYQRKGKKIIWEKYFRNVDVVTFSVSEVFKGAASETIEIATSAQGDAGYEFAGGTWLKEGQAYLVYAYKREPEGTIPAGWAEGMSESVAKELLREYKTQPKEMTDEINAFNGKISSYHATVCGRTTQIESAAEEIEQIRKMFPGAKRFNTQSDAEQTVECRTETATFLSKMLSFFGLA